MDIQTQMRKELVRYLVQKSIFCPILKDKVLDVDTCVVILDGDDDPYMVWSREGFALVQTVGEGNGAKEVNDLLSAPYHFDTATLP